MFILIEQDPAFAATAYTVDTAAGERRARIALAAAGLDYAPVWAGAPDCPDAYRTSARLYADTGDDEVTAVYRPSAELLRAATRPVTP